ncbi:MAG: hypothetical protein OIF40_09285 [Mangrovicoccus sp.]|nr:hypothetical protein [Mangrovicoccus sp.]
MPMKALGAIAALSLALLTGCTEELPDAVVSSDLGEFRLERLVVIVDDPEQLPFSREMDEASLKEAMIKAVEPRFRRFEGDQLYTIGINLQAYSLAAPGIPVLAAPKSFLGLSVNVYDHRPVRLNVKPKRLVITEDAGGDAVVGSGYTQSAQEQLDELADNAAIEIERWLRENPQWFAPKAPAEDAASALQAAGVE